MSNDSLNIKITNGLQLGWNFGLGICWVIYLVLGFLLLLTYLFPHVAKAEEQKPYLCTSARYSLIIGRSRNCPNIERKMRRALRISLEANYRADGLSARSAREQAKRAMGSYNCKFMENVK
jgi:hypothetical protein